MACLILAPLLGLEYLFYSFFETMVLTCQFMMMQSAESIDSIIAKYFVLTDGEITAYGPDGSLVGVSNHVANSSGQLSFFRPDNGATGCSAKEYCELVSFFNSLPSRDWSHSK
jgi:hypothetical protein